jgi:hypothetical protein
MTMRGFLLGCVGGGAVVFIGAAGASGYQLLSRQHALSVAQAVPETSPAAPPSASTAMAVTEQQQPSLPAANPAPASPLPAASESAAAVPPQHVASGAASPDHAALPEKRAANRSAAPTVAAHHPAPRPPAVATITAQRQVPSYRHDTHAVPWQPGAAYLPPPPPPAPRVAYYRTQGYYGYRSGYAYYAVDPRAAYPRAVYPPYPYYPVN